MSATTVLIGLFITAQFAFFMGSSLVGKCFQFFGAFGIFTLIYCIASAMQLNRAGVYGYGMLAVACFLIAAGIYAYKLRGEWYE